MLTKELPFEIAKQINSTRMGTHQSLPITNRRDIFLDVFPKLPGKLLFSNLHFRTVSVSTIYVPVVFAGLKIKFVHDALNSFLTQSRRDSFFNDSSATTNKFKIVHNICYYFYIKQIKNYSIFSRIFGSIDGRNIVKNF